jgi:hypothetical protein
MKMKLRLIGSLMATFLAAYTAQAIILLQDDFPYAAGPIVTESTAFPNGAWFAPVGDPTYGTTADISASGANSLIFAGTSSTSDFPLAYFTNGLAGFSFKGGAVTNFSGNIFFFPSNAPVAAVYASFNINVQNNSPAVITNAYFCYFTDTNFDLHPRVYIVTNTAASGNYRLAIDNNSAPSTPTSASVNIIPTDLTPGTTYTVVMRYVLATGLSTLWVTPQGTPINETTTSGSTSPAAANSSVFLGGSSVTDTSGVIGTATTGICAFGLRNHFGDGNITMTSLIVGTTFEDVLPSSAGSNPAFITVPPQFTSAFVGDSPVLSVVAGGDGPLTYQWNFVNDGVTNTVGTSSPTLTISSISPVQAGSYFVVVGNSSGPSVASSPVTVGVLNSSSKPTIGTQPANQTVTLAGTATFSVTASDGGPPLTYQWFIGSTPLSSETNSSLVLQNVTFNQALNTYSVQVGNTAGTTNSIPATLTVNPPATVSIEFLHTLLDTNFNVNNTTTLFTIKGIVTTYENLTTSGNSEFYIQDGTAGIAVFWSGAPSAANLPPAGAMVEVTAPLSDFDGLIEIEPVFGNAFNTVTVLSTNNPLPAPQPLPFDPNIVNNPTIMVKHLQGSYLVASNVTLGLTSGTTFTSSGSDPLTNDFLSEQVITESLFGTNLPAAATNTFTFTNQFGQTFVIFYNAHCDYIGQPKPTGPLTIYGVLGQFGSSPFTNGYEFTPTRLADFVGPITFTNVISNIIRYGDEATNIFAENVLQPGETITMNVTVIDPGGGNVSLTALPSSPLSSGAWTITSNGGKMAAATFTYTASSSDVGNNFTNSLQYTLSSGTFTAAWTVYVPTPDEQSVRITEIFANPTTNVASPIYNPLQRGTVPETGSIAVDDQYVEIANVSGDTLSINHWTLGPAGGTAVQKFVNGESVPAGSAAVIYGGPASDPNPPTISAGLVVAAYNPGPLGLSTSGGVFAVHDNNGYLVDRVVYPASTTVGSVSRFPNVNSALVPQAYIYPSLVTPGVQYNTVLWNSPTTPPAGVAGVTIKYGNPLTLTFPENSSGACTLWEANSLTGRFNVVFGQQFGTTSGSFMVTNPPAASQFYFITEQAPPPGS